MAEDNAFPRGKCLPSQSPLYWVSQKDRYLRQLLIKDIEETTDRRLIVYYANCDSHAQIDDNDDKYVLELLSDVDGKPFDILIETNGGYTDATEKLLSVLCGQHRDFRAIVPRRAKSNGTLLALAAKTIVMGLGSELGPIDPLLNIGGTSIPVHFILRSPQEKFDPIVWQAANYALAQTAKLAQEVLSAGMLKGKAEVEVKSVVEQLSTRDHYPSHGAVIDCNEAHRLGLKVEKLASDDCLWGRVWLLRCLYENDARASRAIKIFESSKWSNSLQVANG